MENETSRRGLAFPRRLNYQSSITTRRQSNITAVDKLSTKSCGHHRATVRNVVEPDGPASYICKDCFGYLMRIEFKTIVRDQVAALFGKCRPLGEIRGAATCAPIGEGRAMI